MDHAPETHQIFGEIARKIIEHQETIIGPVAIEQAARVPNLHVDWAAHEITIVGDPVEVIENLILAYKELFGQISVEVSREAAGSLIRQLPADAWPQSLK